MSQLIIHKSRRKATVVIVAGFLLGIGGGLFLQYADNAVVGWCFVITALFALIYGFGSYSDRRAYVVITQEGIIELFTIRELVEWDAIRLVDDFYFRGQYFVRLVLDRNYKPAIITPTWFWRFDRIYEREGVKAVYIRTSGLEMNSMQLSSLIDRMRNADAQERAELIERYVKVESGK